jgi:uncharacterized membrane protein YhaH (DUF805 family)
MVLRSAFSHSSQVAYMPIRVVCRCGQSLSVPDAMAGKSGKCPKCAEIIKIPSASSAAPPGKVTATTAAGKVPTPQQKVAKPSAAKSGMPGPSKPVAAGGALDKLFAEAGLDKKKGPECPSCKVSIAPNAAICVQCGFNLATGQKMKGVAIESSNDPSQFSNRQLEHAHRSLKKETEADEAAKYTGAPWWVSLAVVLGMVMVIAFGVIMVEGSGPAESEDGISLKAPANTIRGKIQRLPLPNAMLVVGGSVSSMVVLMAWIATCATAFRDKISQGILCLIPPYPHYYSFANRKKMGSTMRILWGWTIVLIGMMIGLASTGTLQFMLK